MSLLLCPPAVLAAVVSGLVFLGRALAAAGRGGLAHSLRGLAYVIAAGAAAMYAWGILYVAGAALVAEDGGADSSPIRSCRTGVEERDYRIDDYQIGWVPVRFVCHRSDGTTYDRAVPGYVNPALAGLVVTAVALAASARWADERARRP
ncbi:hypothetical protein OG585_54715 (plasmid) [Streptomyces sp. NBC_01340]|uniref:hypothetical protein n=1 Tax=unclassified Streptomyces TaxID=2593676 RepID=UPI00224FC20B|nr:MULTISPECIES: hypothetical protein [unclassified Streptomyces]MCX4462350.1 hypothetical protein [Streptomyces sp. NBC_01719]MCX4499448.1 hypothetical protein [Streptomyces sp. NBC_01728]MCX4500611.1 hypothetical protein [Streptomyces sp. NBC_01728]MCX4500787.1 hypothetical protein [Streptomyces sp. NBC_01728]MCX4594650.1 hypothetical protein [Streptomyces sp. NBC_01549]